MEWAQQMVGVDSARTALVGYSQAAPLMAAVGQLRPELADRLVLASAALPREVLALGQGSPSRAFVAVGKRDSLVDPEILDGLLTQWAAANVDIRTYDIPHVVSLDAARDISDWLFGQPERVAESPRNQADPPPPYVAVREATAGGA